MEPKPMASLSSGLLARKGAARPAMRRPVPGVSGGAALAQDDLGWNDMGYDVNPDPTTPMDYEHDTGYNPLANAVPEAKPEVKQQQERIAEQLNIPVEEEVYAEEMHAEEMHAEEIFAEPVAAIAPVEQFPEIASFEQEDVEAEFPAPPSIQEQMQNQKPLLVKTKSVATKRPAAKRAAPGLKSKSAFTLRLDGDRHLKLRLACAVRHRSAQQLVTEALDAFIDSLPEVNQLASQLPASKISQSY
jgi:hypothetical protein